MNGSHYKIDIIISGTVQPTTTTTRKSHTSYILIFWKIKSFMWVYTKYIFFDWNSKNFHCSAAVIIKCSAKAKLPRSAGSFFLCMMKKIIFNFKILDSNYTAGTGRPCTYLCILIHTYVYVRYTFFVKSQHSKNFIWPSFLGFRPFNR